MSVLELRSNSLPWDQLVWGYPMVFSVSPDKSCDTTLNKVETASFQVHYSTGPSRTVFCKLGRSKNTETRQWYRFTSVSFCAEKESINESLFQLIITDTTTFCTAQGMQKETVPTLCHKRTCDRCCGHHCPSKGLISDRRNFWFYYNYLEHV
jgi:hypothetical protein